MPEEPAEPLWLTICGVVASAVVALGAVACVWVALEQRNFDLEAVCTAGETSECLVRGTGIVTAADPLLHDVRVAYEDGTRTVDVALDEAKRPAPGTRVTLEWWDGDLVALVERDTGRRYRTVDWPRPWWMWVVSVVLLTLVMGVLLAGVQYAVAGAQRLRDGVRRRRRTGSRGARAGARSPAGRGP